MLLWNLCCASDNELSPDLLRAPQAAAWEKPGAAKAWQEEQASRAQAVQACQAGGSHISADSWAAGLTADTSAGGGKPLVAPAQATLAGLASPCSPKVSGRH